jgi:hypothetical protein
LDWVFLATKKPQNRTMLFDSILLKHGRHFVYWNPPLNMRMRLCYLDCHEAGLCCYLVIHIENLLRPLQLFYFQLWPIYWHYLVHYRFGSRILYMRDVKWQHASPVKICRLSWCFPWFSSVDTEVQDSRLSNLYLLSIPDHLFTCSDGIQPLQLKHSSSHWR